MLPFQIIMKRLKIYVAGPATSNDSETVKKNIANAKQIGKKILKKGHLPYVPHTHFSDWGFDLFKHYNILQEHGNEILKNWADALFFIAPSKGADREKKLAEKLGLKIFTDLSEIEDNNK